MSGAPRVLAVVPARGGSTGLPGRNIRPLAGVPLQRSWLDEGVHRAHELPEIEAFSLDDEYEFRLVEALVGAGFLRLPG